MHVCIYVQSDSIMQSGVIQYIHILGLNFDGLWTVSEIVAVVCQSSTCTVNVLCPKFVVEVLLELYLVGAQYPATTNTQRRRYIIYIYTHTQHVCVYYENE